MGRQKMPLFFLFFLQILVVADIQHECHFEKNFTVGSSTNQELVQLLQTVKASAATTHLVTAHSNSSVPAKDSLYVLLQCRRDISSDQCVSCSVSAFHYLTNACPNQIDAVVWFNECFLRYDNVNFFSALHGSQACATDDSIISVNTQLKEKIIKLVQGLVNNALGNEGGFAKGFTSYSQLSKVYGLVQCNQDISMAYCEICLNECLWFMQSCLQQQQYGRILSRNCYIQYGDYMFYSNNLIGAVVPTPVPQTPSMNNSITGGKSIDKKIIIGIAVGLIILIAFAVFVAWQWKSQFNMLFPLKKAKNTRNVEEFLKDHGSHKPERYSYSDIMKITNSMKHKLGEGGFGTVYKGQLPGDLLVAVKILSESKGKGEDFMNEVATISRTAHVNIVSLVGFCSEGSKRALIYDYMSNGSLEKFIFTETPKYHSLPWEVLFRIALGIARGLEYLHRGCNMHILHLDIKPHNILLDEDFCPKISDFGLAKLYPGKQSAISLTRARGTIGYMAPEVSSRNFGGVSSKSDVYSYGMLILEIVGGRKNIDARAEKTSEIYYPAWVYDRIDQQGDVGAKKGARAILFEITQTGDLQLGQLTTETDDEMARKMIIVGLWCIQTMPAARPSMSKVVEMLEGDLEGLQIPPKPFLSSHPE